MIIKIRNIGSSKGIILNKQVLNVLGTNVEAVELVIKDGIIELKAYEHPHADFIQYFKENPLKDLDSKPVLKNQHLAFFKYND